jgi:hypothetical protein
MLRYTLIGLAVIALGLAGCIVSGTFVLTEDFDFIISGELFFYAVDITDEEDWEKRRDDIENIDAVGFEIAYDNDGSGPVTFSAYIDTYGEPTYTSVGELDANAVKILDDITLPVGMGKISYSQSLSNVMNIEAIKKLGLTGRFHFYGVASGGTGTFTILPGSKAIITFTASGS